MNEVLVVLSSLTSANRVKQYIKSKYGCVSHIVQTPKKLEIDGCGYSIKTDYKNVRYVFEAIKLMDIKTKGAFDAQTYKKIKL